jgi:Ca2+-binding EF-hand superfamily protein
MMISDQISDWNFQVDPQKKRLNDRLAERKKAKGNKNKTQNKSVNTSIPTEETAETANQSQSVSCFCFYPKKKTKITKIRSPTKKLPPKNVPTLMDGLIEIFEDSMQQDVTDMKGHLFAKDIITMNKKLSILFPDIKFIDCTETVAETIIQSLDVDNNGSIEMEEFVPWIEVGMSKTKEERMLFASQGEVYQMLIQFMESITKVAEQLNDSNVLKNQTSEDSKKRLKERLEKRGLEVAKKGQLILNSESILPGLAIIFKNACTFEGHLSKEHIVRMIQRLAKDHREAKDFECSLDTANLIIMALDADGNGTVEFEEWSNWIVKGAMRTSTEREEFKKSNAMLRDTMDFLELIVTIAKKISLRPDIEDLRSALMAIFEDATQTDIEGHLFHDDIIRMNERLSERYPNIRFINCTEDCAKTIVQSLDTDNNGSVEIDEFVPWLLTGISKTKEEREIFSSQGQTFRNLIEFMESLTNVAKSMTKEINELKPNLKILFSKYATGDGKDNEKAMSVKDISVMLNDLSSQNIKYGDCDIEKNISVTASLVVEGLDVDGSGTIEWNEFVDWIIAGVSTSNYARKKLSSESEINKKLLFFLEYISEIAKAITP